MAYDLLPVWSFDAVYERPDGEVPEPESYAGHGGFVQRKLMDKGQSGTEQNIAAFRRKYHYFEARHLDERFSIRHRPDGIDVPRPVSDSYGDPRKDWEVVMAFRDGILRREGLTRDSPAEAIARAFAYEQYRHWRGGGPRNHPADVLTHRSWCLGAAITTGTILESLGIPARGVRTSDHAVCEAWIGQRWRVIDSASYYIDHPPGSTPFLSTDFLHLTTDPTSAVHGAGISDFHRAAFYHFPGAHYGIPDGRWIQQSLVHACPAYARALYPDHASYRFKTLDPTRLTILERDYKLLHRYDLAHNLAPGECLRESIYLGEIEDVRHFTFNLRFAHMDGYWPSENQLRHLILSVGEARFPVSELAEWPLRESHDRTAILPLRLERCLFRAHQVNWLTLANASRGYYYRFPLTLGVVEPYIAPYLPAA